MSLDVAASIRSRLLNRAKSGGIEFQLYLVRYACERFLYRLGQSEVRDRLILKGGDPAVPVDARTVQVHP